MKHHIKLRNEELNRVSVKEFKVQEKIPATIVLDNVRSLNNIGSVFRTSDALNIEQIYLCGISATPPHPEIHKTALGAEESVYWQYFTSTVEAINKLQAEGHRVFAIEQTLGCIDLRDFTPSLNERVAFVFGNELKGVDQRVIDICNEVIEVPQFGTKHSFNISVTAGIVLWDYFSKFWQIKKGTRN
ncbi:MAG TPA: TrmH family RNA methyltransferase [Bacteroidetes bacterium]|nr:TrmH family RNA methyltransferase [Bacteroidota bacterium]